MWYLTQCIIYFTTRFKTSSKKLDKEQRRVREASVERGVGRRVKKGMHRLRHREHTRPKGLLRRGHGGAET